MVAPPVLGIIIGSGLNVSWNFYTVAIPGLLGALFIFFGPPYAGSRPAAAPVSQRKTTAGNR